ncbi:MAG: PEGA domain-containing protein [Planctomycetota bacterium]
MSRLIIAFSLILLSSCWSRTVHIDSNPQGADVFINTKFIGVTPCTFIDTRRTVSLAMIQLKKDGYESTGAQYNCNTFPYPVMCCCLMPEFYHMYWPTFDFPERIFFELKKAQ